MAWGAIDIKAPPEIGKIVGLRLVEGTTEMMVTASSARSSASTPRASAQGARATMGIKLLDLDADDKDGYSYDHPIGRFQKSYGEYGVAAAGTPAFSLRLIRDWLMIVINDRGEEYGGNRLDK